MHGIFSGDGWLAVLDLRKPARDHRPSQPLVPQPPVLIILCILCIHVHSSFSSIDDRLFFFRSLAWQEGAGLVSHGRLP